MLAVPIISLPRKVPEAKRTPPYRSRIVPRYDGRWPFIGCSGNTRQDDFVLVGGGADAAQQTHAAVRSKPQVESMEVCQASCGRTYSGAVAIRSSRLQGVAIAAGIGFILALIVR
jgi:hypothetical protein